MTIPAEARLLAVGGLLSAGVALLHFVIIFIGAPAYRYFGAGEGMAVRDARGDFLPAAITALLTMIFALWAAYAFSGAGLIGPLPFVRAALLAIGTVYTLRGLALIPQMVMAMGDDASVPSRHLVFSGVSLLTGLAYLVGTRQAWRSLG